MYNAGTGFNNFAVQPIINPSVVHVNPSMVPQLPTNSLKFPVIAQYVPAIAAVIANSAAKQAMQNAARTTVFNMLFTNNLNNQDFFSVVMTAAELCGMSVVRKQPGTFNIEQEIYTACDSALALKTALLIAQDQNIANSVGPNDVQSARQVLQMHQQLQNEIAATVNMMVNSNNNQFNQGFNQQQQFGMQQAPQQPMWNAQQQNVNSGMIGGFTNRTFGGQQPNQQQQQGGPQPMGRSYAVPMFQQEQQPQVVQPAWSQPELVPEQVKKLVWKPSNVQPHPLNYDPAYEKITLIETSDYDGKQVTVQKIVKLNEEEMDREKHRLVGSTSARASRIEVDMVKSVNADQLRKLNIDDEIKAQLIDNVQNYQGKELNDDIMRRAGLHRAPIEKRDTEGRLIWDEVGFLADAIQSVKSHHAQMKSSKTTLRRERFVVPKVFVCKHDISKIVDSAFKEKNFLITALKLKQFLKEDSTTIEQKQFVHELDLYLAFLINQFLCDSLSITSLWIDSFIDDIPSLFEGYLEKKFGYLIMEKFKENQYKIYSSFLTPVEELDLVSSVIERFTSSEEDKEVLDNENGPLSYVIFEQNYTITSVRLSSGELRLDETTSDCARAVDSLYPALVDYCKNLFENKDNNGTNWAGHLLLSADGKIYNFIPSPIVKGSYMSREFDHTHLLP